MTRLLPLLWALSVVLAGCEDPAGGDLVLANGVAVVPRDGGGVELLLDGRPLVALADEAAPTVRTFVESSSGGLAIYAFEHLDAVAAPLRRVGGAERVEGGVVLRYRSDDGAWEGSLAASADGDEATRLRLEVAGDAAPSSIALPLRCDEGATFHGFGEQYNATDQRGEAFELIVSEQGIGRAGGFRSITGDAHTTYFPMPWFVDARGAGVLVETDHRVVVDLCATDARVAWLEVVSGAPLELVVLHGPTPLDLLRQLGDRVGRPATPPRWAFEAPWIAAQGGRDEVMAVVDRLEAAGVPFSAIWAQDWTGHRPNFGGGYGVQYRWAPDEALYPDLGGMVEELHGRGARFLAYANPFVDPALPDHFAEMDAAGLLAGDPASGGSYVFAAPNGEAGHPDLTNPAARDYVKAALREMVEGYGFDGWMADFGEWLPLDAVLADGSDARAFHNRYPVEWERLTREVMDEARPDGDWVMFARSGWTGVQAVAQIHWAGDQEATWSETDGLPTVVPALLNLGLSGQPFVTHDIAGFSGGPSTKELFMRWVELGAFTPIMRTHEGNRREENWSWDRDEETTAHFRRFARVHEALAPEFEALAEEAGRSSAPILRHLVLAFPDDPATWSIDDQFMVGGELLVAPVLHEGETRREVFLPAGSWVHVWTGEAFEGARTVEVDAPIGSPPVFSLGRDRPELRAIE